MSTLAHKTSSATASIGRSQLLLKGKDSATIMRDTPLSPSATNLVFVSILFLSLLLLPGPKALAGDDPPKLGFFSGTTRLLGPMVDEKQDQDKEELEEFNIAEGFEPGMRELGISAGGSFSMETPRTTTFTLLPKIGWILATFDKPKGALEFELEPFVSLVTAPRVTQEVGATIMMGYNFNTGTRFVPFIHAGGGAIWTGMDTGGLAEVRRLRSQGPISEKDEAKKLLASQLNAIAQMGLGVKYFFKDRTSLNVEYRWRHISDPSTHDDLGIDSQFMLLGVSFLY